MRIKPLTTLIAVLSLFNLAPSLKAQTWSVGNVSWDESVTDSLLLNRAFPNYGPMINFATPNGGSLEELFYYPADSQYAIEISGPGASWGEKVAFWAKTGTNSDIIRVTYSIGSPYSLNNLTLDAIESYNPSAPDPFTAINTNLISVNVPNTLDFSSFVKDQEMLDALESTLGANIWATDQRPSFEQGSGGVMATAIELNKGLVFENGQWTPTE